MGVGRLEGWAGREKDIVGAAWVLFSGVVSVCVCVGVSGDVVVFVLFE